MLMRSFAALAGAATLAACSSTPPPYPPISFTDRPAWRVDAPEIVVKDDYSAPMNVPNVEQEMPIRPADVIHAWVRDRLRAAGTGGTLQVEIRQASVVADPAPRRPDSDKDLKKGTKLTAELDVDLIFTRPGGTPETTSVQVSRSTILTKDLSGADSDKAYYDFTKDLAVDLDKQLQNQATLHMRDALMS